MPALCIEVEHADENTIAGMLEVLLAKNVAIYQRGVVTAAPWTLRWVPDQLVTCDDVGCRVARVSMQQDVAVLQRKGQGSCGSLAAAYAAWLRFRGHPASLGLSDQGGGRWHVVALDDAGRIYDPQDIGGRRKAGT